MPVNKSPLRYRRLVGQNVRILRKHYNLSQEQFGRRLGVSTSTVCCWETGRTSIKDYDLARMCKEFGCSADSILGVRKEWRKFK